MHKRYWLPAAVFLSVFFIMLALGLGLNSLVSVFRSGDMIGGDYAGGISTLTGFQSRDTDGDYSTVLHGSCDPSGLALVSMYYSPDAVYDNGVKTEFLDYGSISSRVLWRKIPVEALEYGRTASGRRTSIYTAPLKKNLPQCLCSMSGNRKNAVSVFNITMPTLQWHAAYHCCIRLNALSVPNATKCSAFSSYTVCAFLWSFTSCLLHHFGMNNAILKLIYTYIFEFAVVLGMATCISFCEFKLKGRWRWLGSWYGLLFLCIAYSLVSNRLTSGQLGDGVCRLYGGAPS
jgi:hypothetical protein